MARRATVYCPDCDTRITLNPHVRLGQRFRCYECDAELEVISVDPLEVDWADIWDDDDQDQDDDDW